MLASGNRYSSTMAGISNVTSMEWFEVPKTEFPTSVYHYTSLSSLVQILQVRQLWASDARYLNDAQEVQFGISIAKNVVEGQNFPEREEWLRILNENDGSLNGAIALDVEPYVVSFTCDGDNLEMWRGYGGEGCAIEFDASVLRELCSVTREIAESGYRLTPVESECMVAHNSLFLSDFRRVVYGESAGKQLFERMFESLEVVPSYQLLDSIISNAAFVKHKAFRSEDEVRLLVRAPGCMNSKVMVREARGHLIPYRTLFFPPMAVKSIIVGPSRYAYRTKRAMERFLYSGRGEWSDVTVNISSIPYLS